MESIAPASIAAARPVALSWHVPAMLVGSTSIVVGILWDISWHMTIGRDTFWTPAHMAIYLGGVLTGICGGWRSTRTSCRPRFWANLLSGARLRGQCRPSGVLKGRRTGGGGRDRRQRAGDGPGKPPRQA